MVDAASTQNLSRQPGRQQDTPLTDKLNPSRQPTRQTHQAIVSWYRGSLQSFNGLTKQFLADHRWILIYCPLELLAIVGDNRGADPQSDSRRIINIQKLNSMASTAETAALPEPKGWALTGLKLLLKCLPMSI